MAANGKLDAWDLVVVQSAISLAPATAAAWLAMKAAAAQAGITLTIARPYGGYRDTDAQRAIIRSGSASGIRVAALGHSTHGLGTRVDVANWYGPRSTWVLANAARFGFVREFGAADPNHFKFTGTFTNPATGGAQPSIIEKDDDMQLLRFGWFNDGGKFRYTLINYTTGRIWQTFNIADATIMSENLGFTAEDWSPQKAANLVALVGVIGPVPSKVDVPALAAALAPRLGGDTDEGALAEKLALALAPQFAAVNTNIDDQPTHFTGALS